MVKFKTAAGLIALGLISAWPADALTIDDSSSALNERFANDPSFIMADYDLSGVGRSSDGRWATLVSQNVFVSAVHFHPGNDSTVTFYQTNDPAGPSITRTVISGQRIAGSDIWVGVLSSPAPEGYATYDFATEDITNTTEFTDSVYHEENAFLVGQSPFASFTGTQNVAVGRNVLDGWADDVSPPSGTTTDDAILTAIEGESQDVTFESTLVSGDSGAPLFVDLNDDNTLRLVGTNWFGGQISPPPTDINGFTYLGNYDAQIQAFIDSQPVPEPTGAAAFVLAGLMVSMRRRRRAG